MALDKKQIVHFKRMLKEAQKKDRFFVYIQEGEDGEPAAVAESATPDEHAGAAF